MAVAIAYAPNTVTRLDPIAAAAFQIRNDLRGIRSAPEDHGRHCLHLRAHWVACHRFAMGSTAHLSRRCWLHWTLVGERGGTEITANSVVKPMDTTHLSCTGFVDQDLRRDLLAPR